MSSRSIVANLVSEWLLLLVTAATTLAAALHASAATTASLAAVSFLLVGARSTNDWKGLAISRTNAYHEIQTEVHQYELTPVDSRDEQTRRAFVARIDAIAATERQAWAVRRRKTPEPG